MTEKKRGLQLVIYPSVLDKFKALANLYGLSLSKLLEYFIMREVKLMAIGATVEDLMKVLMSCDQDDIVCIEGSNIIVCDHDSGDINDSIEVDDITEGE